MLLHRLVEYAGSPASSLPPAYYRPKQIHWALIIDSDGAGATLAPRRVPKGSKETALVTDAPYAYRSGRTPPPSLLVDTAQYVLGQPKPDLTDGTASAAARSEGARRNDEYTALVRDWAAGAPEDPGARAVARFLRDENALIDLDIPEDLPHSDTVAPMVDGQWLHLLPSAQRFWAEAVRRRKSGGGPQGLCLVCGQEGDLLATIPESIKSGAIPTTGLGKDAQIVSINAAAQGRGGVLQLANTPVCERCGSRAMSALNSLLAHDEHRRRTADSVTVWWTREPVQEQLFAALNDPKPQTVARLRDSLNERPDTVAARRVDPNAYYALTLGLNNARVVVRDWLDIPVQELRTNIGAWLADHEVFDGWQGRLRCVPVWQMAAASGRWDPKAKKYAPRSGLHGIESDLMRAALRRGPVPERLLPHLLQRIRADHRLDAPRTALLRLLLNPTREEGTRPMPRLDENDTEVAYLCGRAFAVLEAVQRSALPDLNTTIGDKYFGSVMTAPAAVLPNLRKGANAHFKRLRRDKPGTERALRDKLTDVLAAIAGPTREREIPAMLTMRQQARFVLGYEQQRAEDNAARASYMAAKRDRDAEDPAPDQD
ncbi:CRISPR-associated protein Csd1 [Streptacidiphilus sp. MAP12-16]|uniref:type I-C CRISPR-associated protein Cas8c/Csd1 n=1 Tax=Streptacidiphilus sp. MAP12-16 TaxID=3156300 RepID=UPI0035121F15